MADSGAGVSEIEEKLAYFQAVTGLEDPGLCVEILSAHNWDLDRAVSSITTDPPSTSTAAACATASDADASLSSPPPPPAAPPAVQPQQPPGPPSLAWRLVTLPFYVAAGGVGLVAGAVGLGAWAAGAVLSRSFSLIGLLSPPSPATTSRLLNLSPSAAEARGFISDFERLFHGPTRPNFAAEGFTDALERARRELKPMFVYIHSPDHPDVPTFCEGCLCSEAVAMFLNEHFVCWGGSVRGSEGFKMSNSFKASCFPFCVVVRSSGNMQVSVARQIEGTRSPEAMIQILHAVVEAMTPEFMADRLAAEERRNNMRIREEQDAAYHAALEADRARERQMKEEQDRLEREAAENLRKLKESEETREREAFEAAEKEASYARKRQEKAMLLGPEPEKGPNVSQMVVRFPNGERKERRFHSSTTVKSLYDYVDSLDCLNAEEYKLVSNFPRVTYGPEMHSQTLEQAGLHPQALLFVEMES